MQDPIKRFSIDPDPPQAGQWLTICYDFEGPPKATSPVTVKIQITGGGGQILTVELNEITQCYEFELPSTALTINLHDTSGQSEDMTRIVQ